MNESIGPMQMQYFAASRNEGAVKPPYCRVHSILHVPYLTYYLRGPFPACTACLAFILLKASSPLAPNGLANIPPAT